VRQNEDEFRRSVLLIAYPERKRNKNVLRTRVIFCLYFICRDLREENGSGNKEENL
jgi:hypothetical protein